MITLFNYLDCRAGEKLARAAFRRNRPPRDRRRTISAGRSTAGMNSRSPSRLLPLMAAGSKPARMARLPSMISGRSVTLRTTTSGVPSIAASSCTPPESVTTAEVARTTSRNRLFGKGLISSMFGRRRNRSRESGGVEINGLGWSTTVARSTGFASSAASRPETTQKSM